MDLGHLDWGNKHESAKEEEVTRKALELPKYANSFSVASILPQEDLSRKYDIKKGNEPSMNSKYPNIE